MKEIRYKITAHGAYITDICEGESKTVTFITDEVDDAILKLEKRVYKTSHGVCSIPLHGIDDGKYTPELITDSGCIKLDTVEVKAGVARLSFSDADTVRLYREMLEHKERITYLEKSNRELCDAVFGRKIF